MTPPSLPRLVLIGLEGFPEVRQGDDLVALTLRSCQAQSLQLEDGDVVVFTQKIVSKSEGRIVALGDIEASTLAESFAKESGKDPRAVEVALRESRRVVKMDRGVLITETEDGHVCAHSGVDASNLPEPDTVSLLPERPDTSAARLRQGLEQASGKRIAVIISDTFGRPWREGVTNVAIGVSGMKPLVDYRGREDSQGRSLAATVEAVADEIAGASELVMGKLDRIPAVLVRGCRQINGDGQARELVRAPEKDLFR